MKRVVVAAAVATLALPASALAATFNARVVRSDALTLVLRRLDGRTVTYSSARIEAVPAGATSASGPRPPLARVAGGPRSADGAVPSLDPGIVVRVTEVAGGGVRLGLPTGMATRQRATGVVSAVSPGSILLDTRGGLHLRLRGAVAGLRPCEQATIVFHQDRLTLIADRVATTGRVDCSA